MANMLITGGAGCIGSELASKLLDIGNFVIVYDNMSSGKAEHIEGLLDNKNFEFIEGDILNFDMLKNVIKGSDIVFHMAANPDIKYKEGDTTDKDLKQNVMGTYNVLEAMRINNIKKIVFSSTSAVYGNAEIIPTPERYGPLKPTSLYGASKLACEALISSYCYMFGFQAWIYRFANTIGSKNRKRGTMVITDFIKKLRENKNELEILGNGLQEKSYMLIDDCIDGMLFGINNAKEKVNILNLSPGDSISVNEIAKIIIEEIGLFNVKIKYTGGEQGWLGDVPKSALSSKKMEKLGWKARYNSEQSVRAAAKSMLGGDNQ